MKKDLMYDTSTVYHHSKYLKELLLRLHEQLKTDSSLASTIYTTIDNVTHMIEALDRRTENKLSQEYYSPSINPDLEHTDEALNENHLAYVDTSNSHTLITVDRECVDPIRWLEDP